jgi:hypothetical protein
MSGFPPPSRPDDPAVAAPSTGAPLPPPSFAPPAAGAPAVGAPLPAPEFVSSSVIWDEPVVPVGTDTIWADAPIAAATDDTTTVTPIWDDADVGLAGGFDTDHDTVMPFGVDETSVWDDGGPRRDDDRSEIEELIARAEAEAAGQGGGMPLTFSPPEGVDLRAIIAAEPVEPPRLVLDATGSTPDASGPDWLSELVGSIEDPTEKGTATLALPVRSATFVTADSTITARPQRSRFNVFALLSLMAALVWVCGLGSIVAVILSVVALVQIRTVHQRGRLTAFAGLVLGVVGIVASFVLFVVDGDTDPAPPPGTPVEFDEVIITSCSLDAAGRGVAIVRVVNLNVESVTYDVAVVFQTAAQLDVAREATDVVAPDASVMITVVSETEFAEEPVCALQDSVRFAAD